MKRCFAVVPALLLVSFAACAGVINFEGLPFTATAAGDVTPIAGSVLTSQFASIGVVFGQPGISAGVAVVRDSLAPSSGLNSAGGLDVNGIIPGTAVGATIGDIYFSFVGVTDLVGFTIGDAGGDLDVFQIRSYNTAGGLINLQNVSGNSRFLVTIATPGIHRVEVDFTGNFGYSLDDLQFNAPAGAVPEPSAFVPMLTVLGLAAVSLRRRSGSPA